MSIYPTLTLVLLLALLGCNTPGSNENNVAANENSVASEAPIQLGELEVRLLSGDIPCTGRIDIPPTDLIAIHAMLPGQVSELRYLPGDYVKKGAQLFRLQQPELIVKQRLLLETKAALALAEQEAQRQNTLAAGDATTSQLREASQAQLQGLQATYQGLRAELQQIGIRLSALEEEGQFQSSIGVYAPSNGYVHQVLVHQGQMIQPSDLVMEIADKKHIHLELDIPARYAAAVEKGQKIAFHLPGSDFSGEAEVVKINPMVDMDSGTLRVHGHFGAAIPEERLIPGLLVSARLLLQSQSVTGLPKAAVVKEGTAYFAFRPQAEGFEKIALDDAVNHGDFVSFSNTSEGKWVIGGAYYIE